MSYIYIIVKFLVWETPQKIFQDIHDLISLFLVMIMVMLMLTKLLERTLIMKTMESLGMIPNPTRIIIITTRTYPAREILKA